MPATPKQPHSESRDDRARLRAQLAQAEAELAQAQAERARLAAELTKWKALQNGNLTPSI